MKKIFILLIMISFSVFAKETPAVNIPKSAEQRLALVKQQDDLLNFLLSTPFEMRQYIFPMLSEKKSVPKKIKTHPDILVWKGKKPTRIAHRFENDKELLEYLPAQFYYFLSPEMWPEENLAQEPLEKNTNKVFLNFLNSINSDSIAPEELINLKNGINILEKGLTPDQRALLKKKDSPVYLEELYLFSNPNTDQELSQLGLNSTKSFAKKIDKIAHNYRLIKKGENPPDSEEQKFVSEYFSLIPILFEKTAFESLIDKNLYQD